MSGHPRVCPAIFSAGRGGRRHKASPVPLRSFFHLAACVLSRIAGEEGAPTQLGEVRAGKDDDWRELQPCRLPMIALSASGKCRLITVVVHSLINVMGDEAPVEDSGT